MVNLLPNEFPTLQDCLVDICESKTKGSAGLRRRIEKDGGAGGAGLHKLASTTWTNTVPHRLELKTQDGLPSDLELKPLIDTNKKIKKCYEIIQLVRQRQMGFLKVVDRIYFFLLL